jgi:acyl-CoA thioesterase-1
MKHSVKNLILSLTFLSLPILVAAEEIKIAALGASQTAGKGVAESEVYPAQLEKLLKAEGYSVFVMNEGIDGETTRQILDRMNRAVPDGTRIVILQPGTNDKVRTKTRTALTPEETKKNVEQMLASLKARNINTILLGYPGEGGRGIAQQYSAVWYGQPNKDMTPEMFQTDGQHFTKEGYAVLANNMSAVIQKILGKPQK